MGRSSQALGDSELSFRLLVDSVRDYAIFLLDRDGHVMTWNGGAQRLKGYQRDEIVGQHFSKFYPAEAVERGWPDEELRRAAADGRFEDEGWRVRKDGSLFWANVIITALRDHNGELIGFGKVTRDLSERRNAELSLRAAHDDLERRVRDRTDELHAERRLLQVTLNSIGDAAITTDAAGQITFLNPIAETLTGWTAAEAVGRPLEEVFHIINEHSRERTPSPVDRVISTGNIVGLANHTVLISKSGVERPIDDSAAPIVDENGNIYGVIMVFRDVAERRRSAELQLRLAAIVESSSDAIISKTSEGVITSWNKGAERLYGYRAGEVIGKPISILGFPGERDDFPEIMAKLRRGESIENYETVRRRRDGSRVDVSLAVSPLLTASGDLAGASTIARDISERKQTERRLRETNQELREADRRKNQFLAMLAHELRNPLAPVSNALYVMQQTGATEHDRRAARDIMQRQVQQLARLVDDLLDVSRVMQDRIELRREKTTLASILERAIETVQPMISARAQALTVELPPEPLGVDADIVRLSQAISNLLINASKYTDISGQIRVAARRDEDQVVLSVKDTGIGIAPDLLPQVFELFTQADMSLDRSQGGLGIGLTLVRKLIELHDGTVQAFSEGIGRGSEFVVRLPFVATADSTAVSRPMTRSKLERKVLVVDDNVDVAESTAMLLRLGGHEVQVAYDGPSALSALDSFFPHVILLDIGLPGIDGYELARTIRSRPEQNGAVLVAVTGYGQNEDRQRSHAAGISHHLTKPFDPAMLEALVTQRPSDPPPF